MFYYSDDTPLWSTGWNKIQLNGSTNVSPHSEQIYEFCSIYFLEYIDLIIIFIRPK